jgi:hypothetical protein
MKIKELNVGEVYDIAHARKGSFKGRLLSADDEWATFEITQGNAKTMLKKNEKEKGEEITLRISFCSFWKAEETK